jgi:hypothetical protein
MRNALFCLTTLMMLSAGCADSRTAEDYVYDAGQELTDARDRLADRVRDEPMTQRPGDYDPYLVDNFHGPSAIGSAAGEPQPSVTGLDRDWRPMVVSVPRGYVSHWPAYLSDDDVPMRPTLDPEGSTYDTAANVTTPDEWRLTPGTYLPLATEPLDFAIEAVLLPWRVYQTPPWKTVYSGAE